MTAPDEWAARVMEALIESGRSFSWMAQDEVVTEVLLRMRFGHFEEKNKNLFQRYSPSLFRCHVCNAVIEGVNGAASSTGPHLQMHRNQVMGVLAPDSIYADDAWSCTETPTWEAIERVDRELGLRQELYLADFQIVPREKR